MEQLILGIDSGGSKTIACLGRLNETGTPQELGRGTAGPANLNSVERSEVLKNITDAVAAAFAAAGIPRRTVASAVLAAAGSDRDENRKVFIEWAHDISLADRFRIVHDAWPVLAAGTPECWGVALISGTGSIAFGRAADGRTFRAGGWGFLFGDEGSGYALAVAGLRAAAQAADGRIAPTQLLPAALQQFHIDRPEALVAAVYPLAGDRQRIAEFAKPVLDLAAGGDAVAVAIVHEAARQLAAMVGAVAARLDVAGETIPLALTGGVLVASQLLQNRLVKELHALKINIGPIAVVNEPVLGALKLACDRELN